MATVIINGKKVNVPNSQTSREELINSAKKPSVNPNTRAVIRKTKTGQNDIIKPGQRIPIKDGDKFTIVPDRVKAATYFGNKEDWRKRVIEDQVLDISKKMFKTAPVELDENCDYVVFNGFLLPEEWRRANPGQSLVKMMIIFPDQYPDLPTNGFYLPSTLQVPANAAHFYNRGYGGAFGERTEEMEFMAQGGWKWYCTHIKPDAWQPARLREISDWRKGDNLWDIITICKDVLTHPLDD